MADMEKAEFIFFARRASRNRRSDDYVILYHHLLKAFCHADGDHDGKITVNEFDKMIEDAAVLPRKHGFAPQSSTLYPNDSARLEARKKQFETIDTNKDGAISFDEWLAYSMQHITEKVGAVKPHVLEEGSKDEFIAFIKKAVNKSSQEYSELYYFLVKVFTQGDADYDGQISFDEFDTMIEKAADMPRRHGLAPKTSDMYKSDADRKAARKTQFATVDINNDGHISLDEWIEYAHKHITAKAAGL